MWLCKICWLKSDYSIVELTCAQWTVEYCNFQWNKQSECFLNGRGLFPRSNGFGPECGLWRIESLNPRNVQTGSVQRVVEFTLHQIRQSSLMLQSLGGGNWGHHKSGMFKFHTSQWLSSIDCVEWLEGEISFLFEKVWPQTSWIKYEYFSQELFDLFWRICHALIGSSFILMGMNVPIQSPSQPKTKNQMLESKNTFKQVLHLEMIQPFQKCWNVIWVKKTKLFYPK